MRKLIGILLIVAAFIVVAIICFISEGLEALIGFGIAILIAVMIAAGVWLL